MNATKMRILAGALLIVSGTGCPTTTATLDGGGDGPLAALDEAVPPEPRDVVHAETPAGDARTGDARTGDAHTDDAHTDDADATVPPVDRPMPSCESGATRCDPTSARRVQICRADGSGFEDGALCDDARGEACIAGRCVGAGRCEEGAAGRSHLGCDHWPTVTVNSQLDTQFQFGVALSNPQSYAVHASITGGALSAPREVVLAPGATETVALPWVLELSQGNPAIPGCRAGENCRGNTPGRSTLRRGGAYHVHTDGPIAAYQFNPLTFSRQSGTYFSYTNDASLLLPQSALTRRYTAVTLPNWAPTGATITLGGFVTVVGVSAGTTRVTVRPTAQVASGDGVAAMPAGGVGTFSLQQGDVVQLVGAGAGDLSGTTVESDQPVAVFVGHDCTNVPGERPACDHLEEQLFPDETWGRDYVVSGLRDRGPGNPSVVRAVSQLDDNVLTFDPPSVHAPRTLRAGETLEFSTAQHFRVTGTRAFLVAQFMNGQGPAMVDVEGTGDPAMVLEAPVPQHRTQHDVYVPDTYPQNFFNVVAPAGAALTLDGMPLRGSPEMLGDFAVYTLPVAPGAHRVRSADARPLSVKVYGIARYTSYMYPGGLDLRSLPPR